MKWRDLGFSRIEELTLLRYGLTEAQCTYAVQVSMHHVADLLETLLLAETILHSLPV